MPAAEMEGVGVDMSSDVRNSSLRFIGAGWVKMAFGIRVRSDFGAGVRQE